MRQTIQIRISRKWHEFLENQAAIRDTTISKMADRACICLSREIEKEERELEERLRNIHPYNVDQKAFNTAETAILSGNVDKIKKAFDL